MALSYALAVIATLVAAIVLWNAATLYENYRKAKTTGLPVKIVYIASGAPLWMMFAPLIIPIASYLPFTGSFVAQYRRGWEARVRCRPHVELGDLFIIVTPSGNWLKVANTDVASDILKRKDEFGRDMEAFKVLDIYGKSLATSEGPDWNRHRKVAAVTFTEKNNELVWRESLREGSQMLEYWLHRSPQPMRTLGDDARVFTLNVLAAALFDKSYPFESREESKLREKSGKKDTAVGYRDSLSTILRLIIPILVFGEKVLREAWWLPMSIKKAGFAVSDFRTYVTELINEERALIAQGKQNSPNLVTNLVRACEQDDDGSMNVASSKPRRAILTKDEIISDLFVFAFAGNDTTAITLMHLLAYVSAHPDVQDWISEEIQYHTVGSEVLSWDYDTCVKLKRCWAVVYETLRLCHPLGQLVKTTGNTPRTLRHGDRTFSVPAKTTVEINLAAIHTHPRYWGTESNLTWNPKRFIAGSSLEDETLHADTAEQFFPWAYGRLVCPGKRFSQVELVAVLAACFRDHTVEPVPEKGETIEMARKRTVRLAEDIEMRLLNEMRQPGKVALKWRRRDQP
ncbi:cytochrome P450 monooxygenase-like protein [Lophiotrema nucula]|uniref:Cytochrome P450 monooxygenase-like protein n=1 Tax=Lophiotrema nucula TaxID=690887 RepID=A0A6A5YZV6_9PLEO|nr:cytochrome P450 monooxygenase-like protein [Lophiotrema nucula]